MDRIVIVGTDTAAGSAIANRLTGRFDVSGFWFRSPIGPSECPTSRIDPARLAEQIELADTVYFCGGASQSSWDTGFGNFATEEKWLKACVELSANAGTGFIYVSSDAVFNGPWVFHDDECVCESQSEVAAELLEFESRVNAHPDHLIVRTNIVSVKSGQNSFADRIVHGLQLGRAKRVSASICSTPISAADFASAIVECGIAESAGVINVGGAERTTPYRFASLLAYSLGYNSKLIQPASATTPAEERSLRCNRLRQELRIPAPLLKETLEQVCGTISEQAPQAAAA